jgi:4-aminobutyrate aminotransferase-like enzyme
MVNAFDSSRTDELPTATRELIGRRERALGGAYRLFYDEPVSFVRGSGVYLYDADGNAYLDAYNNVPCVGHSHPYVTEAVSRQLATLNTHTRYLTEGVVSYAERLLATHTVGPALGGSPAHAMFTCTGSEAGDLALRIARHHTGGTGVIVTANAYHGVTAAIAELSPSLGPNVPLGSHVRIVPAPAAGVNFTAAVAWAISDLERHGLRLAAFLADSLFSSDGVLPDPAGFLAPIPGIVHAAGGLYIADEVQAGFARTGSHMWGYQRHGLTPDIVTMGKPMGNGLPIAGLVARQDVIEDFGRKARYFNTFGGNPVCVAAASAVLDILEVEGLAANAAATGAYLKDAVTRFAAGSPVLGDVRGAGLYLGVDVVSPETGAPSGELASAIVNGMRERRVLISATGPNGSVLKIRPPLPFGLEHADQFLDAFSEVLTRTRPAADGQADPAVLGGQDNSASVLRVLPPGHLGIARPPWQQVAARADRGPGPEQRDNAVSGPHQADRVDQRDRRRKTPIKAP